PFPAHRAEHVASQDPGTDAREALLGHRVVDSGLTARLSLHLSPHARVEEPLHQLGPAHAEGILQILTRSRTVTIDGDGKTSDTEFRHFDSSQALSCQRS